MKHKVGFTIAVAHSSHPRFPFTHPVYFDIEVDAGLLDAMEARSDHDVEAWLRDLASLALSTHLARLNAERAQERSVRAMERLADVLSKREVLAMERLADALSKREAGR